MRIKVNFTQDLNNPQSAGFKNLAESVEDGLLQPLKESVQGVKGVDVYRFKEGSVIALYNVIMDRDAPTVNVSDMQSAVNNAITTGNFTGLPVDKTYLPVIGENTFLCYSIHLTVQ